MKDNFFETVVLMFCWTVVCIAIGYSWCYYHQAPKPDFTVEITYPDIAIDTTAPKHKTSWKYKTHRDK